MASDRGTSPGTDARPTSYVASKSSPDSLVLSRPNRTNCGDLAHKNDHDDCETNGSH